MEASLSPIVLIVYNRPEHTKKVVEALARNTLAAESELFIFSDAPKNEAAAEKVNEVRKYLHTISGFKSVHITERPENMGCDPSIVAGISEIISKYGRMIEVEDDTLPSPFFLKYMNDALNTFEKDERVWGVGGYTPSIKIPANYKDEIYMLPRSSAWGFGTWKNRWEIVNKNIPGIYEILKNKQQKEIFCGAGEDVVNTYIKYPNTYDIPIHYHIRSQQKYVVVPTRSLIKNIGTDGTGVHFKSKQSKYDVELYEGAISINPNIQPDEKIVKAIKKFYTKPLWRKCMIWLTKKIKVYNMLISITQKFK